ncbi:MAG: glycosyltransferase family 2 protein [Actinomycetia bacterium]|nr:glycosyltransferase family 2 protein [Actinomycetes bacterium]
MIDVTVCICTYRRPDELRRLLHSLSGSQPLPPGYRWTSTLVVDNDPERSAAPVFDDPWPDLPGLGWVTEPEPGISAARNRAVAEAPGHLVAFVDDDETVAPAWLSTLTRTHALSQPAAVVGYVQYTFPAGSPRWLAGSRVYAWPDWSDGEVLDTLATGNLLIDRSLTAELGPLFDPRFGLLGGEDHHLGRRLVSGGHPIVHSRNAVTYEPVDGPRLQRRTVFKRLVRAGSTLVNVDLALVGPGSPGIGVRARHLLVGGAKLPLGVGRALSLAITGGPAEAPLGLETCLIGIGQISASLGRDVIGYNR